MAKIPQFVKENTCFRSIIFAILRFPHAPSIAALQSPVPTLSSSGDCSSSLSEIARHFVLAVIYPGYKP
ncbi:hypothetical protein M5K25_013321 [Dendrobium thyrsiflorum]|uniref:Uncharacterized protein n=1 Tax=Dendrobium thyrsiflorum TaxID=117978 RepID=A0ABD0UZI9_DENTH